MFWESRLLMKLHNNQENCDSRQVDVQFRLCTAIQGSYLKIISRQMSKALLFYNSPDYPK